MMKDYGEGRMNAAARAMRSIPPADHAKFVGKPFFDGTLAVARVGPL